MKLLTGFAGTAILSLALRQCGILQAAGWRAGGQGDGGKVRASVDPVAAGSNFKKYYIALGRSPIGHKRREGDGRTPEGLYRVDSRKLGSAFHLALHISYPNSRDMDAARKKGINPGGAIMIHGLRNGLGWVGRLHRVVDCTAGCIALTDWEVEELWRAVPDGTPIEIRP